MSTNYKLAANLIAHFEGFIPHAAWDVNAYRCGYGSDSLGKNQLPVKRDSVTTRADALDNLVCRIPKFEAVIFGQGIKRGAWEKLPDNATAALLSFAYNYGHLTQHVVDALERGDLHAVAQAVADRGVDNNGINAKRRYAEATLIASVAD